MKLRMTGPYGTLAENEDQDMVVGLIQWPPQEAAVFESQDGAAIAAYVSEINRNMRSRIF